MFEYFRRYCIEKRNPYGVDVNDHELILKIARKNPQLLLTFFNLPHELYVKILKDDISNIKFLRNVPNEVLRDLVKDDGMLLEKIDEYNTDGILCLLAYKNNKKSIQYARTGSVKFWRYVVAHDITSLKYANITPELIRRLVTYDWECIQYINNPPLDVIETVYEKYKCSREYIRREFNFYKYAIGESVDNSFFKSNIFYDGGDIEYCADYAKKRY